MSNEKWKMGHIFVGALWPSLNIWTLNQMPLTCFKISFNYKLQSRRLNEEIGRGTWSSMGRVIKCDNQFCKLGVDATHSRKPRFSTTDHWIQESIKRIFNSGLFWAVPGLFNPRLFNHELFNPMVQKFMVEKSGVERSGVEAWGWKVQGWDVHQPLDVLYWSVLEQVISLSKYIVSLTNFSTAI